MGADYVNSSRENISNYKIFAYGKLIYKNDFSSMLVLFKWKEEFNQSVNFSLVLFNLRNHRLQSIVELYSGYSKDLSDLVPRFFYDNTIFTKISYYQSDLSWGVKWYNVRTWEEFLYTTGIKNYNKGTYNYSQFYIDNSGYVRFCSSSDNKLPEIVKNEINR